jgi:hypothetical protein
MRKLLFAALAVSSLSSTVMAQRMQLHEEITGENCGPCAATNPDFWALLNSTSPVDNPSKIIHIAYMSPIPSSGWFYLRSKTVNDARRSYYGISSAPNGKHDGLTPSVGLHPANFTQAQIDARALVASPISISVTNNWDATYDSVDISVTITNTSGSAIAGSQIYLRTALVQTHNFATPPGTNGETHFENIVQDMYPNALGTLLPSSMPAGWSQTYTMRGKVPGFVEKGASPFVVAWVQTDAAITASSLAAKEILNAAKAGSTLPNVPLDAATSAVSVGTFTCAPNGTVSIPHTMTLKNTGLTTLTSATLYTRLGTTGAWTSTPWTGSLATGATTTIPMTASGTVSGAGYYVVYDSVANPNGSTDMSVGNNTWGQQFFIESTTGVALPYTTSFETTAEQNKYYYSDDNADNWKWGIFQNGSTSPIGHTGLYTAAYRNYYHPTGEVEIMTLPVVANTATSQIKFWLAHAQQTSTNTDKLELVYSTNCGSSWTSVWSLTGSALATVAPLSGSLYIPTPSSYQEKTVSLSSVPVGAMLAFRATDGGGNMTAIDDINILNTSSVNEIATSNLNLTVFPNPAVDNATVTMNLMNATDAAINVVDGLGRTVAVVSSGKLSAGNHSFNIDTRNLASGVYNVVMTADGGTFTQRLTVAK